MTAVTKPGYSLRDIPSGVWALGFVSMLMDVSSEMIHALLPVYLVTALGTSMVTVGVIEGIAEATASITKIFSGALSDWLGKRKLLAVLGYGLAAFTKPVFPLAPSASWLIGARREMHLSPISLPLICAAQALVCGNRSIPSGPFSAHCSG